MSLETILASVQTELSGSRSWLETLARDQKADHDAITRHEGDVRRLQADLQTLLTSMRAEFAELRKEHRELREESEKKEREEAKEGQSRNWQLWMAVLGPIIAAIVAAVVAAFMTRGG